MGSSQSSSHKVTAQDKAILDLKLQRDKVKQYQRKIQGILDREREIAVDALKNGNKQRALLALRRRRYQESLLTKTDSQLETLQSLVSSIEFSLVEKDILFGLQQGNNVLKELHKEMTIESVEKLMGETADAIAYQREVDELLSSRMTAEEEEDVQAELERLQADQIAQQLPALPSDKVPVQIPEAEHGELDPAIFVHLKRYIEPERPVRVRERQALAA